MLLDASLTPNDKNVPVFADNPEIIPRWNVLRWKHWYIIKSKWWSIIIFIMLVMIWIPRLVPLRKMIYLFFSIQLLQVKFIYESLEIMVVISISISICRFVTRVVIDIYISLFLNNLLRFVFTPNALCCNSTECYRQWYCLSLETRGGRYQRDIQTQTSKINYNACESI